MFSFSQTIFSEADSAPRVEPWSGASAPFAYLTQSWTQTDLTEDSPAATRSAPALSGRFLGIIGALALVPFEEQQTALQRPDRALNTDIAPTYADPADFGLASMPEPDMRLTFPDGLADLSATVDLDQLSQSQMVSGDDGYVPHSFHNLARFADEASTSAHEPTAGDHWPGPDAGHDALRVNEALASLGLSEAVSIIHFPDLPATVQPATATIDWSGLLSGRTAVHLSTPSHGLQLDLYATDPKPSAREDLGPARIDDTQWTLPTQPHL